MLYTLVRYFPLEPNSVIATLPPAFFLKSFLDEMCKCFSKVKFIPVMTVFLFLCVLFLLVYISWGLDDN